VSGYADPTDPRNGPAHHTGKPCVEWGCPDPAGTAWSPYFCFRHNVERFARIDKGLNDAARSLGIPAKRAARRAAAEVEG
jgi:hypothetical protein